jgi:hypothetical protein
MSLVTTRPTILQFLSPWFVGSIRNELSIEEKFDAGQSKKPGNRTVDRQKFEVVRIKDQVGQYISEATI